MQVALGAPVRSLVRNLGACDPCCILSVLRVPSAVNHRTLPVPLLYQLHVGPKLLVLPCPERGHTRPSRLGAMETFYLAGSADDPNYAQAELLGDLLLTRFPNVGFVKDVRHPCEWKEYRKLLTQKYGFNAPGTSVIIWRRDGRLVGSVTEFEKAVKAKYNIELKTDPSFVFKVMEENLETSAKMTEEDKWTPYVGKYKKTWSNGIVFDGAWKGHQPHKGNVQFKEDLVYEGTLKNGLFDGQGVIRYPDGAKFAGIFRNGKKEGLGKFTDTAGNIFEGTYRNDELNGKGSRKWPNGSTYVGQWKRNKANGVGTETIPAEGGKVDVYTGDFLDDSRHGRGLVKYASGNHYEGEWAEGKRNGRGTFVWANAESIVHFCGIFVDGLPSDGQIVFTDGLTAAFPGEVMQQVGAENWIGELSSGASKWFELAKERKARTESPHKVYPIKDADKNVTSQNLPEERWNDLRLRLTTTGVGLHDCLILDNHPTGLVAGDTDCFTVFRELFDPVLAALHPKYPASAHVTDLDPAKLKTPTAVGEIIQSCTIRVDRCVAEFPFSAAVEMEERRKVEELLVQALQGLDDAEMAGTYYPLAGSESVLDKPGGMQPHEQTELEADGLLFSKSDCVDSRDWPDGRGVFCSNNKQTVLHVNAVEHCSLQASCAGFGIPGLLLRVGKVLKGIEKTLKDQSCSLARSDRCGSLLCNLANVGSGMTVEVAARFPRLGRRRDVGAIVEGFGLALKSEGRSMRLKTPGGTDVMRLEASVPFGVSEVEVLNRVIAGVEELVKLERALAAGRRRLWMVDEFPKVVVMGPPGSRRRELAALVAAQRGVPLVSVGEVLRGSLEGEGAGAAKKALVGGAEELPQGVVEAVMERLGRDECAKGWVLEGYARTPEQLESLKAAATPNKVVVLSADNAVLLPALAGRRVDPETGIAYPANAMPEDEAIAGRLVKRACDTGAVASKRIEQARAAVAAAQTLFPKAVKVFELEADKPLEAAAKAASAFVQDAPIL